MEMYDLRKKRLLFKPWQKKKITEANKETKRKGASHTDERRVS